MNYEWDETKNAANKAKDGIPFEDMEQFDWACAVCVDAQIVNFEERELWLGPVAYNIVAVVTVERSNNRLRIISMRRSTRRELDLWKKEMQNE